MPDIDTFKLFKCMKCIVYGHQKLEFNLINTAFKETFAFRKKRQIWTFNADKHNQKNLNLYKIS